MQRLFSTFADGLPGGGILLIRLLTGGPLIAAGIAAAGAGAPTPLLVLRLLGGAAGILIIAGLWTPVVGVLASLVEVCIAFTQPGFQSWAIMMAILGVSLAMIGPGAWSLDARLYGRKEIFPPEP